jgi:hypothetical protein
MNDLQRLKTRVFDVAAAIVSKWACRAIAVAAAAGKFEV